MSKAVKNPCKWLMAREGEKPSEFGAYGCCAPMPEMPLVPASFLKHIYPWPPKRNMVVPHNECATCPTNQPGPAVRTDSRENFAAMYGW